MIERDVDVLEGFQTLIDERDDPNDLYKLKGRLYAMSGVTETQRDHYEMLLNKKINKAVFNPEVRG